MAKEPFGWNLEALKYYKIVGFGWFFSSMQEKYEYSTFNGGIEEQWRASLMKMYF